MVKEQPNRSRTVRGECAGSRRSTTTPSVRAPGRAHESSGVSPRWDQVFLTVGDAPLRLRSGVRVPSLQKRYHPVPKKSLCKCTARARPACAAGAFAATGILSEPRATRSPCDDFQFGRTDDCENWTRKSAEITSRSFQIQFRR